MKIPGSPPHLKLPPDWQMMVQKGLERELPKPPANRERNEFIAFLKHPECEVAARHYYGAVQKAWSRIPFIPIAWYFGSMVGKCLSIRAQADAAKATTPEMIAAIEKTRRLLGTLWERTQSHGGVILTFADMCHQDPEMPRPGDAEIIAGLLVAEKALRTLASKPKLRGAVGRPAETYAHSLIHILAKDLRDFVKGPCTPAIAALLNVTFPDGTRFTAPYVAKILSMKKGRFSSKGSPDSG